jgi:peptidyl-prolyl cis-trans isomerase D
LSDPKPVSRAAQPALPPQALEAVFRASADKLPAFVGVDLGPAGYGVYAVVKVEEPSAEALAQRRPMYQAQLAQIVAQQDASDYVESLKARSKVVRHPERVAPKAEAR